ncbi:hypothetical protein J1614_010957 [Plenodomus biglobosus]|nr:hypothetical protein J1614_010957 [Plenodomus biglobosus]
MPRMSTIAGHKAEAWNVKGNPVRLQEDLKDKCAGLGKRYRSPTQARLARRPIASDYADETMAQVVYTSTQR